MNDYGHPAVSTLSKLTAAGVKVFWIDHDGTIVATCDGETVTINNNDSNPGALYDSQGQVVSQK